MNSIGLSAVEVCNLLRDDAINIPEQRNRPGGCFTACTTCRAGSVNLFSLSQKADGVLNNRKVSKVICYNEK